MYVVTLLIAACSPGVNTDASKSKTDFDVYGGVAGDKANTPIDETLTELGPDALPSQRPRYYQNDLTDSQEANIKLNVDDIIYDEEAVRSTGG